MRGSGPVIAALLAALVTAPAAAQAAGTFEVGVVGQATYVDNNLNWGFQVGLSLLPGGCTSTGRRTPVPMRVVPPASASAARSASLSKASTQVSLRAAQAAEKAAAEAAARQQDSARVAQ